LRNAVNTICSRLSQRSALATLSLFSGLWALGAATNALDPNTVSSQDQSLKHSAELTSRYIVIFDSAFDSASPEALLPIVSKTGSELAPALAPAPALDLSATAKWLRPMSGNGYVLQLSGTEQTIKLSLDALRNDPQVVAVEADVRVSAAQSSKLDSLESITDQFINGALVSGINIPDDPLFDEQWHLHDDVWQAAAIDAVHAWDITQGSSDTVIAVIDTGVRPEHPDLAGRLLPGYDFVSGLDELAPSNVSINSSFIHTRSNDGDGRDSDPTDPGDGVDEATATQLNALNIPCTATESTWHGTGVASLIAANANDGFGLAGIDWNAMILPVRAIGRCGGHRSDLLDAIRWAAGVEDPSLPPNPTPAHIINLSLGMEDHCSSLDQAAINDAVAAGAVVVSAVGNQGQNTAEHPSSPAQCDNVIGVAATDEEGYLAGYSNFGRDADISAPGGLRFPSQFGVTVATNGGFITENGEQTYKTVSGTSVAAPLVSGTLGLMRSVQPDLSGAELTQLLLNSSVPFPTDSENRFIQHCNTTLCGEGLLNAHHAVRTTAAYIPQADEFGESGELAFSDAALGLDEIDNVVVGGSNLGCAIHAADAYDLSQIRRGQDPSLLGLLLVALLMSYKRAFRLKPR